MNTFVQQAVYFGAALTLGAYFLGRFLQKKTGWVFLNPLLIATLFTIGVLVVGKIDYAVYEEQTRLISWLLTPATVCFALPLYDQWNILKRHHRAIVLSLVAGTLTSLLTIFLLSYLMQLSHSDYVTLLPKSITTAIAIVLTEQFGGNVPITAAVIMMTGISGNILAITLMKVFRIHDPVATGLALGCSAHAIGTAKALELGETEGAMASLAIAVSGILTVLFAPPFARLM